MIPKPKMWLFLLVIKWRKCRRFKMKTMKEQLDETIRKAEAYDNLKSVQGDKIVEIRNLLESATKILGEIGGGAIRTSNQSASREIYDKLVNGTINKIYRQNVESLYSVDANKANQIIYQLKKLSGVEKGKDDKGIFFFFDKSRVK